MQLKELLAQVPGLKVPDHPALTQTVQGLTTNSQAVQAGELFIGMPGTRVDGGDFWQGALTAGAIAAVISPQAAAKATAAPENCLIVAEQVAETCAQLAVAFNQAPTEKLKMIGVTGTNGKTTTTHLIEFLLERSQQQPMMMGTLYTRWQGFNQVAAHTTPFPVDLQKQLAQGLAAGCQQAIMEVSSHALAQGRALGCEYDVAIFTNLTQDHLDYHNDMEEYFEAKALLFSPQYLRGRGIINQDDAYGQRLIERLGDKCWRYSTETESDLWLSDIVYGATGVSGTLHTPMGSAPFASPLVGQFNLANMLAAIGAGLSLGLNLQDMVKALPEFVGVPGRMERIQVAETQDISVIVDYAHTPDSLENLLKASRPFIPGKMICVFGCGGDRDRTKRPKMGGIAATLADHAVVTSDNPRTEDPQQILTDVVAGIPDNANPTVLVDRGEAIQQAILAAKPGDGILIAGKGHEDYQILGTEKIHFDDREQARAALQSRLG
ncbi:UDP-N-acetylmuramoyl-L-alanyl-D-glutamate--2,6-diaminopimelate ligase [filamentous cyanobacterium LEGE 11480]|uniref:UDP-N-acetylmuramoyl-L-alanyl-D-glutamate--2,6-diaminopimelate ligase n=1 Tax=Romeriopsis navalis LEGE 11480 TaxID=2777977 RepID=A0A928VR51_9CYAN|nr:UDP-N-acetylmuramoyl-L-alanyl-D-glutamate--2,6-diaminopimelate ligase [Romeriopsis navalis]MBE9033223.1 UDP-N-acetylmuramoyl-L-alanyl-D-glutamate--2,6-diaminopimelate ligase [Romeriopsis navalis LEGE 11480]